jgi:hypothetical protein
MMDRRPQLPLSPQLLLPPPLPLPVPPLSPPPPSPPLLLLLMAKPAGSQCQARHGNAATSGGACLRVCCPRLLGHLFSKARPRSDLDVSKRLALGQLHKVPRLELQNVVSERHVVWSKR